MCIPAPIARTGTRPAPIRAARGRRRRAFTMLEILIVLGLLVVLAGFAWPVLQSQISASELPESAQRIRNMLNMARAEAVMEHKRYRIRFAPDAQQPIIEYEPDPILRPNEWEPVPSAWAREPMLLADVQVHEVLPGRPVYLEPLGPDEDPAQKLEDALAAKDEAEDAEAFDAADPSTAMDDIEAEIDENRPMIVFESDGSAEWATLILAEAPLDEPLEEETEQLWVILDGRTGLAFVRGRVTEEQLADPEFYVQRDKLELPEQADLDTLSLQVGGGPETGATAGADSFGDGPGGTGSGPSGTPDSGFDELEAAASGSDRETKGNGPGSTAPVSGGDNADDPHGGGRPTGGDAGGTSATPDNERKGGDLTEEEQANIRRTLGNFGGGG